MSVQVCGSWTGLLTELRICRLNAPSLGARSCDNAPMKVLNLQCQQAHLFEGWFASEDDFQYQQSQGLVQCPICSDSRVEKLPSAPRLNLGANPVVAGEAQPAKSVMSQVHSQITSMVRQWVEKTEDVGDRFTAEARKMHYGETEQRSIRGKASLEQAAELIEEGIDVMPLPMPEHLKKTLQ
jgi:hypothetical protein